MSGGTFAAILLFVAFVSFIMQPPWRMPRLILLTWFFGLLALSLLTIAGGLAWIGTPFGYQMLTIAAALTGMFVLVSVELLWGRTPS